MKRGDLIRIKHATRLRENPLSGGNLGKYPAGTLYILLEEEDPTLYHIKVLAPDGKTGWIFKDVVAEVINETG